MAESTPQIICVALNPAVDRTFEVHNLEVGQHAKARLLGVQPAGKAVNVARVFQHLGQPCVLTGFIGESERAMFERSFNPALVQSQLLGIAQPTRENFTLVDVEKGLETHLRDLGPQISDEDRICLVERLQGLAGPGVWMIFAGSLPQGLDAEQFREILSSVTARGALVVVDSSERALAVARQLPAWLIKPNRAELAVLAGMKTDTEADLLRAANSLSGTVQVILASAGAEGCYLVESGRILRGRIKDLPERIVNSVGSGDALLATYLAGRARCLAPHECLRQAVAAATSSCFHIQAGEVDREQMAGLMDRVAVDRIP